MKGVLYLGYLALGLFQFLAIVAGFKIWLGISAFFAAIISLFLAYTPILGTGVGMYGAVSAWNWSWLQAGALFFGPFIAIVLIAAISGAFGKN